jgi:hypothetical protein
MTWVLGVVDGPVPPHVESVTAAGLTAVVDGAESDTSRAPVDLMVRHAETLSSLLVTCDAVLPMRGGSWVPDADAVRDLLHDRVDELRRALDEVRGAVELAVTCEPVPTQRVVGNPGTDGRSYLGDRVTAWRWADEMVDAVGRLELLEGVRQVRVLVQRPAGVKASLLVATAQWPEVRTSVVAALPGDGSTVRCTGPFAPYSFSAQHAARPMAAR